MWPEAAEGCTVWPRRASLHTCAALLGGALHSRCVRLGRRAASRSRAQCVASPWAAAAIRRCHPRAPPLQPCFVFVGEAFENDPALRQVRQRASHASLPAHRSQLGWGCTFEGVVVAGAASKAAEPVRAPI